MGYALDRPEFSIRVEGGFVGPERWLIHGVVEYGPLLATESRGLIESEARIELLRVIARQSQMARSRGVRAVYVSVHGDDEVAGFFRMLDPDSARSARRLPRS